MRHSLKLSYVYSTALICLCPYTGNWLALNKMFSKSIKMTKENNICPSSFSQTTNMLKKYYREVMQRLYWKQNNTDALHYEQSHSVFMTSVQDKYAQNL